MSHGWMGKGMLSMTSNVPFTRGLIFTDSSRGYERRTSSISIASYSTSSSSPTQQHHTTYIPHHTEVIGEGPIARYELLVKEKKIKDDPAQREALTLLQRLYDRLIQAHHNPHHHHHHHPHPPPTDETMVEKEEIKPLKEEGGWFSRLFSSDGGKDEGLRKEETLRQQQRETKKRSHVQSQPEHPVGVYLYGGVGGYKLVH